MEVEFMTADTALPPCMPLPRAMLRLPISSTAKVMYARMLDIAAPDPRLHGGRDHSHPSYRTVIRLYPGQERALQKRTHWHSHPDLQEIL